MELLQIVLLILILILIFRDVLIKMVKEKMVNKTLKQRPISKEYRITSGDEKNLLIDVLDTDVKILVDKDIDEIYIKIDYLYQEAYYNVFHDDFNIKILRDGIEDYKKVGHSGRVLIKIPEKCTIASLNLSLVNGDVEIYDSEISNIKILSHTGSIKVETLKSDHISFEKYKGDIYLSNVDCETLNMNIKEGNGDFGDVYGESIHVKVLNGDFSFGNVSKEEYEINDLKIDVQNGKEILNVKSKG